MSDMQKIIGVGSPVVDSIAQVEGNFIESIEGEKGGMLLVEAQELKELLQKIQTPITKAPGGSAGNTLFALARLGVSASLLGKTGNCSNGQFYRDQFQLQGGDINYLKIGGIENGHCLSIVTPDGERTMRTHLGAAMTLSPDEVSPKDFEGCQFAHLEGYLLFNEALMDRVLKSAKAAGCQISLDLASFEVVHAASSSLPKILDEYIDIVFANEDEASAFTGIKDDYSAMVASLNKHCDVAAVKMGALGSLVGYQGVIKKTEAVPVDAVVDTTAAGDLWAAGFLYGWMHNLAPEVCAKIGSILGAAVVQQQGSTLSDAVWTELSKIIQNKML